MLTIISTKSQTQSVQRKLCTTENPENMAEKQFVFYRRGGTAWLANGSGVDDVVLQIQQNKTEHNENVFKENITFKII